MSDARAAPPDRQRRQRTPRERPARRPRDARSRPSLGLRSSTRWAASLWVAVGLAVAAALVAFKYLPRQQVHGHAPTHQAQVALTEPPALVLTGGEK